MTSILLIGSNRIWTIEGRAGPTHAPVYQALGFLGALDWPLGDVTKIEIPSDKQYNQWIQIGDFQASADRVTATLTVYEKTGRSEMLDLALRRCALDIQIHKSLCADPRDFDNFDKVRVVEDAKLSSFATSDNGALEGDGQDKMTEELGTSGARVFDILPMTYAEVAATQVGEVVIAVDVCDSVTCGDCVGKTYSDGCQRVYAVTNSAGSSPGLKPQVIATPDNFTTIVESWVTTFAIGENASDGACVGDYFVVLSSDGEAIHYTDSQNILDADETWTKVTTGIVASSGPTSIYSYSPLISFVAGLAGYVYKMASPVDGLTVLDAGSLVTDNLNEINGYDGEIVAAVGDAGAFVYTTNGQNFNLGTGPSGPTNLNTLAYRNEQEVWVGGDDGVLYYTVDYGQHWGSKNLPGSLTAIDKIIWLNETVGFVAGRTVTPVGKIYRTINGGYSWYLVPENASLTVPANDYILDMVGCESEYNRIYAGGLADNGADGILIRGSD